MKQFIPLLLLLMALATNTYSQDSTAQKPARLKKWELNGYIKDLETIDFIDKANNIQTDNLIHNRINFHWFPIKGLTFVLEERTRLYYGPLVALVPGYGDSLLHASNDIYKMSWLALNKQSLILLTTLDRAFVDYTTGQWDVKVGRQRINWGVNLVWNPNDIFNAYSFYDFDYEERPGSDAVRLTYYATSSSNVELAGKLAENPEEIVAAAMYKFNAKQYDFQFLGGVAHEDLVAGWGYAGPIGGASFKGEMSYFQPYLKSFDSTGTFSGSLSIDNVFKHDWYLNVSVLYNSSGSLYSNLVSITSTEISAKNLYPYRYSLFTQISDPVTPLFTPSLSIIYSPAGDNAIFINPGITYSIAQNWQLDIISQLFIASFGGSAYKFQGEVVYTRLKWSF